MTPGQRAAQQFGESSGILLSLIILIEWVKPILWHQEIDWGQCAFACAFSALAVIALVAVAYLRPPSQLETAAQVEAIVYEEIARSLAPGMPKTHMPSSPHCTPPPPPWPDREATWATTTPGMPIVTPRQPRG